MIIKRLIALAVAAAISCGVSFGQSIPFPGPGGTAILQAATTLGTASNTSGATLTLAITVPANAAIAVCVNEFSSTDGTMADATNGAYTKVTSIIDAGPSRTQMFVFYNSAALTSITLTYTKGTGGSATAMAAAYVTGVTSTDSSVTATGLSTNANPPVLSLPSNNTSAANVMLLACAGGQMQTSGLAFTQDGSWGSALGSVISVQSNSGNQASGASRLIPTSGTGATWNPTWSAAGAARQRGAIIIGMKP